MEGWNGGKGDGAVEGWWMVQWRDGQVDDDVMRSLTLLFLFIGPYKCL